MSSLSSSFEKLLLWRHCHDDDCEVHRGAGPLILIGDAFHNFVDGVVIAAAFLISIPLGVGAALAVVAHEVPQEVGDFAVLLDSGYDRRRALLLNVLSASATLPGALIAYFWLAEAVEAVPYVLAVSAASFTYSTLPLVPQVVDAVKIPVLAAGGIGDARGFLAAFALGGVGIQMGTRFMATTESDLNAWGRAQLLSMRETDTIVTRAMTGATVRCIRTPGITAYEDALARNADAGELTEFKRRVRGSRYAEGKGDRRQSAAGQVGGMISDVVTVRDLIDGLLVEAARLAERMPTVAKG